MWWVASAFALPPPAYVGEFVVAAREDAPQDARLLVEGSVTPGALVLDGPGAGAQLEMVFTVGSLVAVLPPAGGWTTGAPYTVGALDPSGTGTVAELTFSAVGAAAADPVAPEVGEATAGEWSRTAPQMRDASVEVDNLDPDPWSVVVLTYDLPSRGAVELVEIGPGPHVLSFQQVRSHDFDPCVEIVGVAADGDTSDAVPICLPDEDDDARHVGTPARGCVQGAPRVGWLFAVVALVLQRRRSACG